MCRPRIWGSKCTYALLGETYTSEAYCTNYRPQNHPKWGGSGSQTGPPGIGYLGGSTDKPHGDLGMCAQVVLRTAKYRCSPVPEVLKMGAPSRPVLHGESPGFSWIWAMCSQNGSPNGAHLGSNLGPLDHLLSGSWRPPGIPVLSGPTDKPHGDLGMCAQRAPRRGSEWVPNR